MSLLSVFAPKLALRRAFPPRVSDYFQTSIIGSSGEFSVGYNFVAQNALISAITIFRYPKRGSITEEFETAEGVIVSGDDYEHIGESTKKITMSDGSYAALVNRYATTLTFDNAWQRVFSDTYLLEAGTKFLKIRSTFPVAHENFASRKLREFLSHIPLTP